MAETEAWGGFSNHHGDRLAGQHADRLADQHADRQDPLVLTRDSFGKANVFEDFRERGMFLDATVSSIQYPDKVLPVHRVVLASASRYFQQELSDENVNLVVPSSVSFYNLSRFIDFIYTGSIKFASAADRKAFCLECRMLLPRLGPLNDLIYDGLDVLSAENASSGRKRRNKSNDSFMTHTSNGGAPPAPEIGPRDLRLGQAMDDLNQQSLSHRFGREQPERPYEGHFDERRPRMSAPFHGPDRQPFQDRRFEPDLFLQRNFQQQQQQHFQGLQTEPDRFQQRFNQQEQQKEHQQHVPRQQHDWPGRTSPVGVPPPHPQRHTAAYRPTANYSGRSEKSVPRNEEERPAEFDKKQLNAPEMYTLVPAPVVTFRHAQLVNIEPIQCLSDGRYWLKAKKSEALAKLFDAQQKQDRFDLTALKRAVLDMLGRFKVVDAKWTGLNSCLIYLCFNTEQAAKDFPNVQVVKAIDKVLDVEPVQGPPADGESYTLIMECSPLWINERAFFDLERNGIHFVKDDRLMHDNEAQQFFANSKRKLIAVRVLSKEEAELAVKLYDGFVVQGFTTKAWYTPAPP